MRIILLTQGKSALVDDDECYALCLYKWYAYYDYKGKTWYAVTYVKQDGATKQIRMHRLIMNAKDGQEVDHINHDGLDNRKSNLRIASRSENARNQSLSSANSSGYKGVYRNREKDIWRAHIRMGKESFHLGYFHSVVDAARAYDDAAKELFGEFACLNFPDEIK